MSIQQFFVTYWRDILSVMVLFASLVLWIVRKKPVQVVDTMKETIVRLLPYCILKAESAPKGEKLSVCLALLKELLEQMGLDLNSDYTKFASEQVEIILSTPQKKGIK